MIWISRPAIADDVTAPASIGEPADPAPSADSDAFVASDELIPPLQCVRHGGGGGEVPTPFGFTNRRAELADGELYELVGWVATGPAVSAPFLLYTKSGGSVQAYFKVDLTAEPWLASLRRKANPYYPLEGEPVAWSRYEGRKVRVTVQAEAGVLFDSHGDAQYVIFLKDVQGPGNW